MKSFDVGRPSEETRPKVTRKRIAMILGGAIVVAVLTMGGAQVAMSKTTSTGKARKPMTMTPQQMMAARTTPAMRKAAALRAKAKETLSSQLNLPFGSPLALAPAATVFDPQGKPDYFGTTPNFANSPLPELYTSGAASGTVIPGTGIRKFVDSLPGLGVANKNDLGQY